MSEYAKFNGQDVKIGTCETMYYLRYEDRTRVKAIPFSLDPAKCQNLFWRLPFPDEDGTAPGHYEDYKRGLRLFKMVPGHMGREYAENFADPETVSDPGIIQLHHSDSGLLLNVPCYHGTQLPEVREPMRAFWNGKGHSFELAHVKNTADRGLLPVVRCRHCGRIWRYEWAEILPFIHCEVMRRRLTEYAEKYARLTECA